ncbi:hypothetical protein [Streptomyces sp. NPDC013455]
MTRSSRLALAHRWLPSAPAPSGTTVYVVGPVPALGGRDPAKAVKLS